MMLGPATKPFKIGKTHAVAFSSDGALLATFWRDIRIWNLAQRSKLVSVHPLSHPSSVAFSPDGRHLAAKSTSGRIVVIDAQSGQTIVDFDNARDGEGSNLLYSACGAYLVDGSWKGRLSVRHAGTGKQQFAQDFQDGGLRRVYRLDDGSRWIISHASRATASDRPPPPDYFSIWEWPFRTGANRLLPQRIPFVGSSAVSSDGQHLAVVYGAPPKTLSIFRLGDGECAGTAPVQPGGTSLALGWAPNGRRLGSVQKDKVVFYQWPGLNVTHEAALSYPSDVAFSPDGRTVALGSWEAGVVLFDDALATGHPPLRLTRGQAGP